jgi:hypothetical protein
MDTISFLKIVVHFYSCKRYRLLHMGRLPWRIDSSESAIVSLKLGHGHLLQRRIVRDLQGKFHSFGGSYANIATSLTGRSLGHV